MLVWPLMCGPAEVLRALRVPADAFPERTAMDSPEPPCGAPHGKLATVLTIIGAWAFLLGFTDICISYKLQKKDGKEYIHMILCIYQQHKTFLDAVCEFLGCPLERVYRSGQSEGRGYKGEWVLNIEKNDDLKRILRVYAGRAEEGYGGVGRVGHISHKEQAARVLRYFAIAYPGKRKQRKGPEQRTDDENAEVEKLLADIKLFNGSDEEGQQEQQQPSEPGPSSARPPTVVRQIREDEVNMEVGALHVHKEPAAPCLSSALTRSLVCACAGDKQRVLWLDVLRLARCRRVYRP